MNRFIAIRLALTLARTVSRRYLNGRDFWAWHHHHMTTNDPYARILIQGIVTALWQETFDTFLRVLARTVAQLGGHLKHGDNPNQ